MADQATVDAVHLGPLGHPVLKTWELNENSTRYERLQAAPSDETLMVTWAIWVAMSGVIALFVSVVLASILSNSRTRKNPFNLYLVYLMIPDILFSAGCALSCLLNVIKGEYGGTAACQFQSFYLIFGFGGNSWLNMMIAREVHQLLQSSSQRQKYRMPTARVVTSKALCVYAWAAFVASWGIWGSRVSWWHHETIFFHGMGCFPLEYSTASTWFYFLVFLPLVAGIPICYVLYIAWDVWRRKLMPPAGKRRLLSIYFLRIVAAYVIMWIPYLVLCLSATGKPLVVFAGGSWGHLQGVVSSVISLTKPDVYRAFYNFVTCNCWGKKNNKAAITPQQQQQEDQQQCLPSISSSSRRPQSSTNDPRPEALLALQKKDPNSGMSRSTLLSLSNMFMWPTTSASGNNAMLWSSAQLDIVDRPIDLEENNDNDNNSTIETNVSLPFGDSEQQQGNDDEPDDFLPMQHADFTYDDETDELQQNAVNYGT